MKIRPYAKTVVASIGAFFTVALAILTPLTGVLPEKVGGYLTVAVAVLTALSVYWAKNGNKILDTLADLDDGKYLEAAIQTGQVGGDTSATLAMVLGELQKLNRKTSAQLESAGVRVDRRGEVEKGWSPTPVVYDIEIPNGPPLPTDVIIDAFKASIPREVNYFVRNTWGAIR